MLPGPTTATPARRPGSIRRTSHLDTAPSPSAAARFVAGIRGAARDLYTDPDGHASPLATATLAITVGEDGRIDSVRSEPTLDALATLAGAQIGAGFRAAIAPALRATRGDPLGLLIGDLTGAPAPMRYGLVRRGSRPSGGGRTQGGGEDRPPQPGACFVWRRGGRAATARDRGEAPVLLVPPPAPVLETDEDPLAWHEMGDIFPEESRRRRRIDLWIDDDDTIAVDAMFRDVNVEPDGAHVVVHEYVVGAQIEPDSGRLLAISTDPRALPQEECPLAAASVQELVGASIEDIALDINRRLPSEASCTHLNDLVRFLGDVPLLAEKLARRT
jgi:Protein of unknown function (DUF2889)